MSPARKGATPRTAQRAAQRATKPAVTKRAAPPLPPVAAAIPQTVLVVDVGGTHVKLRGSDWTEVTRVDSGPHMGPAQMVDAVRQALEGRRYDVVAMGYPGVVRGGVPAEEPVNLAQGWVGFDYAAAFGTPVRTINDAAMQALGNYAGSGNMLFIGFGTGMGSAFVTPHDVLPLELAHLPYRKGRTYEEYVGAAGRERMGDHKWERHALRVAVLLRDALQATDVVLGGGNAKRLHQIPDGMRLGAPDAAFLGGLRLWNVAAVSGAIR